MRFLGTFLNDPTDVPISVIAYVAQQLEIADINCLSDYQQRRTGWKHITAICQQYGYQPFSQQPEHWQLTRWIYLRAWLSDESPGMLFDQVTAYLVERKILLPGVTTLERLVSTMRERVQQRLWQRLAQLPTPKQRLQLESLLTRQHRCTKRHWSNCVGLPPGTVPLL